MILRASLFSLLLFSTAAQYGMQQDITSMPLTPQISWIMQDCIRHSLQEMAEKDQELHKKKALKKPLSGSFDESMAYDRIHVGQLKKIIATYGWPTISKFGADAAHNAWLIAQHADHDPEFQVRCFELMCAAITKKDVSKIDIAYLADRILVNNNRPQYYGTQLNKDMAIQLPVEECQEPFDDTGMEILNARREKVGLPSIQEYLIESQKLLKS